MSSLNVGIICGTVLIIAVLIGLCFETYREMRVIESKLKAGIKKE